MFIFRVLNLVRRALVQEATMCIQPFSEHPLSYLTASSPLRSLSICLQALHNNAPYGTTIAQKLHMIMIYLRFHRPGHVT